MVESQSTLAPFKLGLTFASGATGSAGRSHAVRAATDRNAPGTSVGVIRI